MLMEFFYIVTPKEKRVRAATCAKGASPSKPGPDVSEDMGSTVTDPK